MKPRWIRMTESKQSKKDIQKRSEHNDEDEQYRSKNNDKGKPNRLKQRNDGEQKELKQKCTTPPNDVNQNNDETLKQGAAPENRDKKEINQLIAHIQKFPEDKEAQEKIVLHYEGLVHSLAGKYSRNQGNHEDLVQVGMIGLLIAVKRFNEEYGKSFEAFAIPTIRGETKRCIGYKTWESDVLRRIKEMNPKINRAVEELTNTLQKSPSVSDIAK